MSTQSARPLLQKLSCPNCGAPLDQFSAGAQTIVCSRCGGFISIGSGHPILAGTSNKITPAPVPINIGDLFTYENTQYFVLGRVLYDGWDTSDISDRWQWNEWLLGSNDGLLVWLSYDEKGFSLYSRLRIREAFNPMQDRAIPVGNGRKIAVHERYPARILGAEGELTWKAKPGDTLTMVEGAGYGKRYSVQFTSEELEIHEGDPWQAMAVAKAFNSSKWIEQLKRQESTAKLQGILGIICFVFAAIAAVMGLSANSSGEQIATQQFSLSIASPSYTFPIDFDQVERPAIVSMSMIGSLPANTSVDLEVSVTSPNEVKTYLFTKSFWHETGRDEDGPWVETDYNVSDMFVPTLNGSHIVEVLLEDNVGVEGLELAVNVKRNHTLPLWYAVYAVIVGLVGVVLLYRMAKASGLIKVESD